MSTRELTAAAHEKELRAACLELEQRLRSGEECSAEQLLALHPRLSDDVDSALELIFAEFVLRHQRGEQTHPEQWYQRFPQWRERLERLLHVYEIMGTGTSPATAVAGDTVRSFDSQPTPRLTATEPGRIGDYDVLEEIARGGMGVVYKARHGELKRVVALKVILAGEYAGVEQRTRFRHEAEAAARLQHPNIVQIFEIGQEGNLPFLAMEYVDGPPLDQFLNHRRAAGSAGLPPRQAAELVKNLAHAIHHAHQQGVVHRDLKPANILLGGRESRVECQGPENTGEILLSGPRPSSLDSRLLLPKITDFGLAKTLNQSQVETRTGLLIGTPSYMAPEQAAGRPADIGPATDIFALGVILYELLTGYLPFQGTSVEETLQRVRAIEPIPVCRLQRAIPRDLQTICLKCLQKEPVRRYPSAQALAEDLQRLLRDEPILARPVRRSERVWRWCRRNPAVALLTGGIAMLLIGGTTVATTLAVWAMNEKGRAAASASQSQVSAAREREARALADHRFAQAEKAVEDYLDGIERNDRLRDQNFQELRKQLLASALPFYEDFVQQKPGDPNLDFKRGKAYLRLGSLRNEFGEHQAALSDFNQMHAIFQKLVSDFPNEPEYRHQLGLGHNHLGVLSRKLGNRTEADEHYRAAILLLKALTTEFPQNPHYRSDLARTHSNLATLLGRDWGQNGEAAEHHRLALMLRKELVDEFPDQADYQEGLATVHNNFGIYYYDIRNYKDAESEYRQAFLLRERLANKFPDVPRHRLMLALAQDNLATMQSKLHNWEDGQLNFQRAIATQQSLAAEFRSLPDYRERLAGTHYNYGVLLTEMANPVQAKIEYLAALQIRQELVDQFPEVVNHRFELGTLLNNLGILLSNEGELDEARRLVELAVEHQLKAFQTAPKDSIYSVALRNHYYTLADVCLKQKDHVAAAQAADQLAAVRPDVADDPHYAAGFFCRCVVLAQQDEKLPVIVQRILAKFYADRAMVHLHEAVRRGFADFSKLKTLDALTPLRNRPDFQKLVGQYRVDGAQEGEQLTVIRTTKGTTGMQWMVAYTASQWSCDQQLYWIRGEPGAKLELQLPVTVDGTYNLELVLTKAPDYAVVQLALDDAKLGEPVDLFHPNQVVPSEVIKHSSLSLTSGNHVLSLEIVGANPEATKYYMVGLDYVRVVPAGAEVSSVAGSEEH